MGLNNNLARACLFLFLFAWVANVDGTTGIFNVNSYGAVGDGKHDSTKAFQKAWAEACATAGNPTVLIPGGTYYAGPLAFKGPCKGIMNVKIQGNLVAPTDLNAFPSGNWIEFLYLHGLVVSGGGKLDAKGASAWPHNKCPKQRQCNLLPTSLKLSFVTDATISDITSIDSKFFHILIFQSKNIEMHSIRITAPGDSPNTDGIHIGESSNININNTNIATGDDCISIGPSNNNITITRVFCGPGHGISVGSLGKAMNEKDVVGLHVKNCTLSGTMNGVRIKTWQATPVAISASNLNFEDIIMNNVFNPIIIDQKYCPYATCTSKDPSKVKISEVKFRNIRGTSASKVAVNLICSDRVPCKGVELSDINLKFTGGEATSSCANVKGTHNANVKPASCI